MTEEELRKRFSKDFKKNPAKTLSYMPKKWVNKDLGDKNLGMVFVAYIEQIGWLDKENGISPIASVEELLKLNNYFRTSNGCTWARSDISWLGKRYKIKRTTVKCKTEFVQLVGLQNIKKTHYIRPDIAEDIRKEPCAMTGMIGESEADHKNGRYNDPLAMDPKTQIKDDFQPLCKKANDIKRQCCKICNSTGKRFNAETLGYSVGWIDGDENYIDGPDGCVGCYLYDIKEFRQVISKDFKN